MLTTLSLQGNYISVEKMFMYHTSLSPRFKALGVSAIFTHQPSQCRRRCRRRLIKELCVDLQLPNIIEVVVVERIHLAQPREPCRRQAIIGVVVPVSYTHLRAHETRSNL
eukprot:5162320-Heterocapsa_arctica.AAC.1